MSAVNYRTSAGDTVDEICFKHYGTTAGTVEAVLEANQNLADHGIILDAGISIVLPEITVEEGRVERVSLWD